MKRKPDLNSTAPPSNLGEAGATLWATMIDACRDDATIETLRQICHSADSAAHYAQIIDSEGATIESKHGTKDHPLCKHLTAQRALIVRGLSRIKAASDATHRVGRPGYGGIGWVPPELR